MNFSAKTEYGVRLMVELGRQYGGSPTSLKAISEAEGLPLSYLEHVVADLKRAGLAAGRAAGPDGWRELIEPGGVLGAGTRGLRGYRDAGVEGAGGVDVHIRSGALTPSMPRPLANTWRAATQSASRARCRSLTSSSPMGSTRQVS